MISLLQPTNTNHVLGRGTALTFDTRTQPSAEKLKRGDFFSCLGHKYQVTSIERTQYLTSPPTVDPKISIFVREIV